MLRVRVAPERLPTCGPEGLPGQASPGGGRQLRGISQLLAVAVQHGLVDREALAQVEQLVEALAHVRRVQPVEGLVDPPDEADVAVRGQPQPELHVPGVRQARVEGAHSLQRRGPHDHLRGGDGVLALLEDLPQPPVARPDRPAAHRGPGLRVRCAVGHPQGAAVHEPDLGTGVQQVPCTAQRTRREPVVGRHQHAVVTVGPLEQTLVVGGDVPAVDRVDDRLDTRVAGGDRPGHVRAVIRRGVVDDEDPDVDALLVGEHAGDGLLQEVAVVVAGDHDAQRTHGSAQGPQASTRPPPSRIHDRVVVTHPRVCSTLLRRSGSTPVRGQRVGVPALTAPVIVLPTSWPNGPRQLPLRRTLADVHRSPSPTGPVHSAQLTGLSWFPWLQA